MLKVFQECKSVDGWVEFSMASSRDPDTVYKVLLSDWGALCDCKGFQYGGDCKHIAKARTIRCRWKEGDGPVQTRDQRRQRICPNCGGPTRVVAEVEEETWLEEAI